VTLTCANSYLRVLPFAACCEDGVTKLLLFVSSLVCVFFFMLRFTVQLAHLSFCLTVFHCSFSLIEVMLAAYPKSYNLLSASATPSSTPSCKNC